MTEEQGIRRGTAGGQVHQAHGGLPRKGGGRKAGTTLASLVTGARGLPQAHFFSTWPNLLKTVRRENSYTICTHPHKDIKESQEPWQYLRALSSLRQSHFICCNDIGKVPGGKKSNSNLRAKVVSFCASWLLSTCSYTAVVGSLNLLKRSTFIFSSYSFLSLPLISLRNKI